VWVRDLLLLIGLLLGEFTPDDDDVSTSSPLDDSISSSLCLLPFLLR
jgi:hypothetical protein